MVFVLVRYFNPLHLSALAQRLHVPFAGCRPEGLVRLLRRLFADVVETRRDDLLAPATTAAAGTAAAAADSSSSSSGGSSSSSSRGGGGGGSQQPLPELTVSVCGGLVRIVFDSELLRGACVLEWNATPAADLVSGARIFYYFRSNVQRQKHAFSSFVLFVYACFLRKVATRLSSYTDTVPSPHTPTSTHIPP